jgi:1,2-dihydroxy-3-keto-5-methylthiopentene dioxygenase
MQLSWLDVPSQGVGPAPCTLEDLARAGVTYSYLSTDPTQYEPALAELSQKNGYTARDEVALSPDTPNLPALLEKFRDEHLHEEDEVRFVLAGAGIFDIRSADDRWMRVQVGPGDVLVVPKGRYHRFFLTADSTIRCVRLFQDPAGWKPVYRPAAAAQVPSSTGPTPATAP